MDKSEFVEHIIDNKLWEDVPAKNQVVSTGRKLSLAALDCAFESMEVDGEEADVIVTSHEILETIECWGYGPTTLTTTLPSGQIKEKKCDLLNDNEDRPHSILGVDMHISDDIPENIVLIGSKSRESFARVEVID